MNNILQKKEIQYEEIQTEHGIFTSNIHLGLTAQEVYDKWLYDKENPSEPVPTLEEIVEEQESKILALQEENQLLNERINDCESVMSAMYTTLIEKNIVTLDEIPTLLRNRVANNR